MPLKPKKRIIKVTPKKWWSIKEWRRAKALEEIDNWLLNKYVKWSWKHLDKIDDIEQFIKELIMEKTK